MRNVINLLQEFGIHVKFVGTYDRGDTYHSACPRSGCSKENGFHVWPGENSGAGAWWCRGCGKGGDGIQFLRDYRGLSFKDACNALDISKTDYQTLPKIEHKKPEFQPKSAALPEEKWQEKAKILIGFCHMKLLKNEAQLAWLKKRGISKDAVIKYQLGWNEKAIWRARSAWGLPEEKNKDGKIKALFISAGLIIPVMHKGTVYKINIRRGPDHSPPYLPIAGSKNTPLMLGSITKGCVVVETHLDGFMLNEMIGDLAGVLVLGTVDAKPTDLQTGRLKKAVCILVALDFDGRPGGKASKWWAEHFPRSRRWPVPTGKDPGEALEKGLDIREWIYEGLPPYFKIKNPGCGPCEEVKEGGGAEEELRPMHEEKIISIPVGQHPDVKRLYQLIEKAPVKITTESGRLKVDIKAWFEENNPEKCCEISALVFSSDVDAYLTDHPAEVIDNNNFWEAAA